MPYAHSDHPVIILMRGLPGSGKSHLVRELKKELGDGVVVLDPDTTDYQSAEYKAHVERQVAEGVDPALHAYRFLRQQAYDGIAARKLIIWDQPFTNLEIFQKMLDRLRTHAKEQGTELAIMLVEVELDPVTAKERVQQRKSTGGHGPSDGTFARRVNDYASFEHLGHKTVKVQGGADVRVSAAAVLQALSELA
ncbi:MAG TPA: ATP-binding protein [Candidatus Saccharimonadales bacterium]